MGIRAERKAKTRERVIDAARDLFDEIGYEAATIRLIADRAGVSVGSVFTTFATKAEVLDAILAARLGDLYAEIEATSRSLTGSTADRLRGIFGVHYRFETRRLRLYLAYLGQSYAWRPDSRRQRFGANPKFRAIIGDILKAGMDAGEVRKDLDVELALDLLIAAYAWNYRAAADGAGAEEMVAAMDRQIDLLCEGFAPR